MNKIDEIQMLTDVLGASIAYVDFKEDRNQLIESFQDTENVLYLELVEKTKKAKEHFLEKDVEDL